MNQFLVIIRGAPASGKTTISKKMRNFEKKVAWLKVDNFKDFFSEDSTDAREFVDGSALVTLEYLLDKGFSVVMEKIFLDPVDIPSAIKIAEKRDIPCRLFQIKCSLKTLQERDRTRPGIKEGCRKPLGDETIKKIYETLETTFLEGAIVLNTEEFSANECVQKIKNSFQPPLDF